MELEQLVHDMDSKTLIENLEVLIAQTHVIEEEYNTLRQTFDDVLESQSNALWIFNPDGKLYLQNSIAKDWYFLYEKLDFDTPEYELTVDSRSYLIKVNQRSDKIIVSATDITDQKRKESLAIMGQMAAHLSHEIRNPIGSIALLTSSLLKRVDTPNKPVVFEIQKAIFRIERIINATLMFSKGIEANKEACSLKRLSQELDHTIGYYSYTKDITFEIDLPHITVQADFELLMMAFSNFIFNAIDAIEASNEEEGTVFVHYDTTPTHHRFEIIDTGVPFSDTAILFEAFQSTKEKGNGLGLVLCKDIIECHDGSIEVVTQDKKGFVLYIKK